MKSVLSSGSIAMDVVLNCNDLPVNDGFSLIHEESMQPGGSSANVVVAAAGFGLHAYQTGKVSDDEMGQKFRASLIRDGVDERYLLEKKGGVTMHTYIITAPGGKHTIFAHLGNCMQEYFPEELPADLMDSIDILYTDLFSCARSLALVHQAVERGKPVVLNLQAVPSFMEICGVSHEALEEALGLCDIVVSGREAFYELVDPALHGDVRATIQTIQERYEIPKGVICTLGGEGALWYDGDFVQAPAYSVEAVDTTGAGDCFLGALLYVYYDRGMGKEETLSFCNAAAAIKCGIPGPRHQASAEEVQDFRSRYGLLK